MKKFFIATSQFILSAVLFTVLGLVFGYVAVFIINLVSSIPLIGFIFMNKYMVEGITTTFVPFFLMSTIGLILSSIYKKNFSFKANMVFTIYVLIFCIYSLIQTVNINGLISWNAMETIWASAIYVGVPYTKYAGLLKEEN